jgi:hypothetical protein
MFRRLTWGGLSAAYYEVSLARWRRRSPGWTRSRWKVAGPFVRSISYDTIEDELDEVRTPRQVTGRCEASAAATDGRRVPSVRCWRVRSKAGARHGDELPSTG